MAVTKDTLRTEVGVGSTVSDDVLQNCVSVAEELVRQHLGKDATGAPIYLTVPTLIYEKAWLSVAVELFNQRKAPNGVLNQQFATPDGGPGAMPVRIGADPLRPAYPLLSAWVGGLTI